MDNNFPKIDLFGSFKPVNKQQTAKKPKAEQLPRIEHSAGEEKLFDEFELAEEVLEGLKRMGYVTATAIQSKTAQYMFKEQDLLCLSETGSGKTLSFVLPVVSYLVSRKGIRVEGAQALILAPTRELCIQINQYFERFREAGVGEATSVVLYGGIDPMKQVLELSRNPSVLVATPGRLLDHLQNTAGFSLKHIKYLILDEADKLLNKDFELQFNSLLEMIPKERVAYLYSATLTRKVEKLERVSLKSPIRIEVSHKYQTVEGLQQSYVFIPSKLKDCYLVYLLNTFRSNKTIAFVKTRLGAERITLLLKELGFAVECLHGQMSQIQRIKSLDKFKKGEVPILACTDVAARGIDISMVEFVINYDLCDPKNYIHRVGRTARVGRKGQAISIVTQYDVEEFKRIEDKMGFQMKEYPVEPKDAEIFLEKIELCHQQVSMKMKKHKKMLFDS